MITGKKLAGVMAAAGVFALAAGSAQASVSATGSVSAVPDGANYLYTITLNNTGTQNIETFWFSWLPDNYDFLPSEPTPTGQPASWTNYVETGYYGSSIEFYDTASNPILSGHSSSAFQFESPDTPDAMKGTNPFFGVPVTYSYVYNTAPDAAGDDPVGTAALIFSMPVQTPEPSAITLLGIGGAMRMFGARRRKPLC